MKTASLVCIVLALGATACAPSEPASTTTPITATAQPTMLTEDALIERGEYLVIGLLGCNDCHTPMTPTGPDMSKSLQGADLIFAPLIDMPWAPHAPALAGLPDGYDAEQFAHFLQTGEKSVGGMAMPPMPPFRLNAEDARAAVAYIASLPRPA